MEASWSALGGSWSALGAFIRARRIQDKLKERSGSGPERDKGGVNPSLETQRYQGMKGDWEKGGI